MNTTVIANSSLPDMMPMNGEGPFLNPLSKSYESFTVTQGTKTKFLTVHWAIEPNFLGPLGYST